MYVSPLILFSNLHQLISCSDDPACYAEHQIQNYGKIFFYIREDQINNNLV